MLLLDSLRAKGYKRKEPKTLGRENHMPSRRRPIASFELDLINREPFRTLN